MKYEIKINEITTRCGTFVAVNNKYRVKLKTVQPKHDSNIHRDTIQLMFFFVLSSVFISYFYNLINNNIFLVVNHVHQHTHIYKTHSYNTSTARVVSHKKIFTQLRSTLGASSIRTCLKPRHYNSKTISVIVKIQLVLTDKPTVSLPTFRPLLTIAVANTNACFGDCYHVMTIIQIYKSCCCKRLQDVSN